jgi:AsmA protein
MLKKVLIGIAALILLVILGLVVLVATFDVDRYKPRIEQQAHETLGRTLKFDGKLSLSVFPTIAVALPHTTLSEHGSDAPFLSLDRARVSLEVLPLLSGRLEAGTASLYGLHATIDRHVDGSTSVDDLTGGGKSGPQTPQAPGASAAGAPMQFELGGVDLVDAQVVYRDEKSRNTVTVSKLNLKTGRIATKASTPIDFSASIAATEPPSNADLSLKTTADLDLANHAFGARDLEVHARGHSGANQFDIALTAPKIAVDPEHMASELVKLVASVAGGQQVHADLSLQNLTGSGDKISIGKMAAEIDLESPALPQKSLKVNLDGSLSFDAKAQGIGARLGAHFDETNIATKVAVQGFSTPHIAFDAEVDKLNLDRYLRASAPGAAAPGATAAKPAETAAAAPAADPKVDLSPLKPLNLIGEVRIGALQVHHAKVSKIKVGVHAAGGRLDVAPMLASLYEGSLNGTARLEAEGNRVAVNTSLDGISIGPLLSDLMGKEVLDGHGGMKLNVTTAGATVGAMRRALGGSASLALRDGAVHGINIAQKLRDVKAALGGGTSSTQAANAADKTDFSELTGSFAIKNGVATNNDLLAKSPLLRLNGAGTIDIGAGALDYTVQASVVGTLAGQGGGDLANLHGVTIPVHLTGPFTAMSYQLDWGSVARQAVKSKATEQLKNLLGNKLQQGGQSSGQNSLGDALKGLLGKPPSN